MTIAYDYFFSMTIAYDSFFAKKSCLYDSCHTHLRTDIYIYMYLDYRQEVSRNRQN